MTQKEREEILRLRFEGKSYTQIADSIRISRNTVKSICQRTGIQPAEAKEEYDDGERCRECGAILVQNMTSKPKRFCSDVCRRAWWKQHQDKRSMISGAKSNCVFCGLVFEDYEKNRRKYCCHACYIRDRFEDKNSHDKRAI